LSTPLIGRNGRALGALSTHSARVGQPAEWRLRLLDHRSSPRQHLLALGRQHQPLADAVEQRQSDIVLERLQLP